MVYEEELAGLTLGAKLLLRLSRVESVTFSTDNQAGIQVLEAFNPTSGHHLVDLFLNKICCICSKFVDCPIQVQWVPGHEGIQGNKIADDKAKKAAAERSSPDALLPAPFHSHKKLPFSRSALKQKFHARLKANNSCLLAKSPQM
jgi:ribonuclease HI